MIIVIVRLAKKKPVGEEQKESSEELSQIKPTPGEDGIHTVAVFPSEVVTFQAVV